MKRLFEKRRLGRTGFEVSVIGIGGAWLGNTGGTYSEEVAAQTIQSGLDAGINLIDTSDNYIGGKSERFVGNALAHWYGNGGQRENIFLSTKISTQPDKPDAFTYGGTMRTVEDSLTALRTDYIDIMHIHDPVDLDQALREGGALTALRKLKIEGTIRAIGLGCRSHAFHRRCIETGDFDVSLTFEDYNLLVTTAEEGVLVPAGKRDVGVLNASIYAWGLLGGDDPELAAKRRGKRTDTTMRARELWSWCKERDLNLGILNLHFCLRDRRFSSILIGFSRPTRVEQNIRAYSTVIEDTVWEDLARDHGIVSPPDKK